MCHNSVNPIVLSVWSGTKVKGIDHAPVICSESDSCLLWRTLGLETELCQEGQRFEAFFLFSWKSQRSMTIALYFNICYTFTLPKLTRCGAVWKMEIKWTPDVQDISNFFYCLWTMQCLNVWLLLLFGNKWSDMTIELNSSNPVTISEFLVQDCACFAIFKHLLPCWWASNMWNTYHNKISIIWKSGRKLWSTL